MLPDLDHQHREVLGDWHPEIHAAALGEGRYAIAGGASVAHLWIDGHGRHQLRHLRGVRCLASSPAGRLATGSDDMGVRVFDARAALQHLIPGHLNAVTALGWVDERSLVSASLDGSVRRHALGDGVETRWVARSLGAAFDLAVSQGRLLVAAGDRVVELDLATGTPVRFVECPDTRRVVLAPDGRVAVERVHGAPGQPRQRRVRLLDPELATQWEETGRAPTFDASGRLAIGVGPGLLVLDGTGRHEPQALHEANVTTVARWESSWLTGAQDGTVCRTDEHGRALAGRQLPGAIVACDARGRTLFAVAQEGTIARWSVRASATPVRTAPSLEPSLRLSVDGYGSGVGIDHARGRVVVCGERGLQAFASSSGERLLHGDPEVPTFGVQIAGDLVATRHQAAARTQGLYDAERLEPVALLEARHVALGATRDGTVGVLTDELACYRVARDGDRPRLVELRRSAGPEWHASGLSPDAERALLASADGDVVLGIRSGDVVKTLGTGGIKRSAFTTAGDALLVGSLDRATIHELDSDEAHDLGALQTAQATWSGDGAHLAVGVRRDDVHLFRRDGVRTGVVTRRGYGGFMNPVFLPDGERALLGTTHGGDPCIVDLEGGRLRALGGHAVAFVRARVVGDRILTHSNVSPSPDLTLRLWTLEGDPVASLTGHEGDAFFRIEASPCERWVASMVLGDDIRVWRTSDGARRRIPRRNDHRGLAFAYADDGTPLLVTASAGAVEVWPLDAQ